VESLHYGTASNVWQVGMMMARMTRTGTDRPPWNRAMSARPRIWNQLSNWMSYQSRLSEGLRAGGETIGDKNDYMWEFDPHPDRVTIYSAGLRATIHECLMIQHADRPTPARLVEITRIGLEAASEGDPIPLPAGPAPAGLGAASRYANLRRRNAARRREDDEVGGEIGLDSAYPSMGPPEPPLDDRPLSVRLLAEHRARVAAGLEDPIPPIGIPPLYNWINPYVRREE